FVGICGGVPRTRSGDEILLGDVVIGRSVVQYDLGRQYPDRFLRRDTVNDNLAGPANNIRAFLAPLEDDLIREGLEKRSAFFLEKLQEVDLQNATRSARRQRQA